MSKHTPTPWKVLDTTGFMTSIYSQDEMTWVGNVALQGLSTGVAESNAAHIVKCVNEHEVLQAQVAELVEALEELHSLQNGPPLPSWEKLWKKAMAEAEHLIRKHTKGGE